MTTDLTLLIRLNMSDAAANGLMESLSNAMGWPHDPDIYIKGQPEKERRPETVTLIRIPGRIISMHRERCR